MLAPPRYLTPANPDRAGTYGPAIGSTAKLMHTPLLPWQVIGADRLGSVYADGRFVHPFVVITVPRQAGKTTLVLANCVHRALYMPNRRIWYTAQTGKYARDKWGEMVDVIEKPDMPLRQLIAPNHSGKRKAKRTNGDESLTFLNGSTLNPHPPTRDGLHSKQSDLNNIDEAWAHDALAGEALMGAITPTQATRPFRQTVVLSTEGDARSEFLAGLIDRGRAGDPGICLIDYGVPEGTDPDDHETVARWHPAYGPVIDPSRGWLVDDASLRDAADQLGPGEYLRAYGNLRSGAAERVIPEANFNAAATDLAGPGTPAFGVAVAADRSHGSIWGGWLLPDGRLLVELVDRRPGVDWMPNRLVELNGRHTPRIGVAADPGGPAGPVVAEYRLQLTRRGRAKTDRPAVLPMTRADYAAACGDVYDRLVTASEPGWLWRPDPDGALIAAAAIATKLSVGDGAFVWGRRASAGSVADLEAATLAGYAAQRAPVPSAKPRIVVART